MTMINRKTMDILQYHPNNLLLSFAFLCLFSICQAQYTVNVEKERPVIESRDALYSKYILEGDSVAIAAMYASDGMLGCKKGDEILSSTGSWITNSIKNDSRHVTFKTFTLTADGELLIENGTAECSSDKDELKYTSSIR